MWLRTINWNPFANPSRILLNLTVFTLYAIASILFDEPSRLTIGVSNLPNIIFACSFQYLSETCVPVSRRALSGIETGKRRKTNRGCILLKCCILFLKITVFSTKERFSIGKIVFEMPSQDAVPISVLVLRLLLLYTFFIRTNTLCSKTTEFSISNSAL